MHDQTPGCHRTMRRVQRRALVVESIRLAHFYRAETEAISSSILAIRCRYIS